MELIGLCHRVVVMRAGEVRPRSTRPANGRGVDRSCHRYSLKPLPSLRLVNEQTSCNASRISAGCFASSSCASLAGRWIPDFATADNVPNVLTRTAFIGIIAVGMTFVIISGGIDLSVGSMAALIAGAMISC